MLDIDVDSTKEQRKFGLSTGAVLGVLGLIRFALHHFEHVPYIFWGFAVVFAVLGFAAPATLRPVLRVAIPVAEGMNWVITRIVLTLAWYVIMTPSGILYRMITGDPLKRAWDPKAPTYWEDADPMPQTLDEYRNQF